MRGLLMLACLALGSSFEPVVAEDEANSSVSTVTCVFCSVATESPEEYEECVTYLGIASSAATIVADGFHFVKGWFVGEDEHAQNIGVPVDPAVLQLGMGTLVADDLNSQLENAVSSSSEKFTESETLQTFVDQFEEFASSQHTMIEKHLTQQGQQLAVLEQGQRDLHEQLVMLRRAVEEGFETVLGEIGQQRAEQYQIDVRRVLTNWKKATKAFRKDASTDKAKRAFTKLLNDARDLAVKIEVRIENLDYESSGGATVGLQRVPLYMALLMAKRAAWDAELMLDPEDPDVYDEMQEFAELISEEALALVTRSDKTVFDVAVRLSAPLSHYAMIRRVLMDLSGDTHSVPAFRTAANGVVMVPSDEQPVYWDDGFGQVRWLTQHLDHGFGFGTNVEAGTDIVCTSKPFQIRRKKEHEWFVKWQHLDENEYEYERRNVSVAALLGDLGIPGDSVCAPKASISQYRKMLRMMVLDEYKKEGLETFSSFFGWSKSDPFALHVPSFDSTNDTCVDGVCTASQSIGTCPECPKCEKWVPPQPSKFLLQRALIAHVSAELDWDNIYIGAALRSSTGQKGQDLDSDRGAERLERALEHLSASDRLHFRAHSTEIVLFDNMGVLIDEVAILSPRRLWARDNVASISLDWTDFPSTWNTCRPLLRYVKTPLLCHIVPSYKAFFEKREEELPKI